MADISSFTGPGAADLLSMVSGVSGSGRPIPSASRRRSRPGLQHGDRPEIYDSANQAMDQNRNGVPGSPGTSTRPPSRSAIN
jgi:hypothetical protein